MARRSAASAKPTRAAASSVRVVPASAKAKRRQVDQGESLAGLSREEKRARKQELRRREDRIYTASTILMREDPDYPRYRRIWIGLMAAGMVFVAIGFALLALIGERASEPMKIAQYVTVGMSYVCIIAGFAFDFIKIRPIRTEAQARAKGLSESRMSAVLERGARKEKDKGKRKVK
nr:hypothetical protein [Collinsella urealyticum]